MSIVKGPQSVHHENIVRETRPIPDPTILTTQQLLREIGSVREIVETRFAGMDKAIELLQSVADRQPSFVSKSVERLQELHEEKFRSVAVQFVERDTRADQMARDSRVAIDAALSAQVKSVDAQNVSNSVAIAKSEAAFTKQIDQIGQLIFAAGKATDGKFEDIKTSAATADRAIDSKIDDVKTRLNVLERNVNASESRSTGKSAGVNSVGVVVMGVIAAAAVFISIATLIFNVLHSGAVLPVLPH